MSDFKLENLGFVKGKEASVGVPIKGDPGVVNLDWIHPDKATYDNYPSTNQTLRSIPGLVDQWHKTTVPPQKACQVDPVVGDILLRAKRAMMEGFSGSGLADHLKSKFVLGDLKKAQKDLVKLAAEEHGLLGNVYIDPTAYVPLTSEISAANFCQKASKSIQNKSRLAKYVLKMSSCSSCVCNNEGTCSAFKKNLVAEVSYTPELLEGYSKHLSREGKIASTSSVRSKEALQEAFLSQKDTPVVATKETKEETSLGSVKEKEVLKSLSRSKKSGVEKEQERLRYAQAKPVLRYTQDLMIEGSTGQDLKQSIRAKFTLEDIKVAAPYLSKVIANQGIQGQVFFDLGLYESREAGVNLIRRKLGASINIIESEDKVDVKAANWHLDNLVFANKLDKNLAAKLKEAAKENPMKSLKVAYLAEDPSTRKDLPKTSGEMLHIPLKRTSLEDLEKSVAESNKVFGLEAKDSYFDFKDKFSLEQGESIQRCFEGSDHIDIPSKYKAPDQEINEMSGTAGIDHMLQ